VYIGDEIKDKNSYFDLRYVTRTLRYVMQDVTVCDTGHYGM